MVYESWLETDTIQDPEELGKRLHREKFEAVVIEADFLLEETFQEAPRLRIAGVCRAATNHVDIDAATKNSVAIINAPGRNTAAVAELTIGLMLTAARRIIEADSFIRGGKWVSPTDAYRHMRGRELNGATVGVVGLGSIGLKVAALCKAFGMRVMGYDPAVGADVCAMVGIEWMDIDAMLPNLDFLTLHASPQAGTILNSERIKKLPKGAIVINTAVAELIDEASLIDALAAGNLSAGLDSVYSHPIEPGSALLKMDNVVLTPHIGGATEGVIVRHSQIISEDMLRFKRGQHPVNLVNEEVWDRIV